jgi:hypothetical protein
MFVLLDQNARFSLQTKTHSSLPSADDSLPFYNPWPFYSPLKLKLPLQWSFMHSWRHYPSSLAILPYSSASSLPSTTRLVFVRLARVAHMHLWVDLTRKHVSHTCRRMESLLLRMLPPVTSFVVFCHCYKSLWVVFSHLATLSWSMTSMR